jgi:hypothetical protein
MLTDSKSMTISGSKRPRTPSLAGLAAVALAAAAMATPAARADGQFGFGNFSLKSLRVIGLTDDGRLVRFRTSFPEHAKEIGFVSGLQSPDTALIGIDFRVQDGKLYGVGDQGGLYTIDPKTAAATPVPAPIGPSLDIALQGSAYGVDFNPAANALRIVSDTGQNLRHPFAGATQGVTVNDTRLTYVIPPNPTMTATGVTAAAYTNNDLDTGTGTTLFDIDTANAPSATDPQDVVAIQSPANAGTLVPTGSLGIDAGPVAGFDIYSRLKKGVAVENRAFASLSVGGPYGFYRIDLLTGRATLVGEFGDNVVDIAFPLNQH